MATSTVGAIATRPTGNIRGGYYFIRLDTEHRIICKNWTPLTMPSEVVDQIHRLAHRAKASKTLSFTNVRNEDLDVLDANIPSDDEFDLDEAEDIELAGVDDDGSDDDGSEYKPSDSDSEVSDDSAASDDESNEGDNSDDKDDGDNDSNAIQITVDTPEVESNAVEENTNDGDDGEILGVDSNKPYLK